MYYPNQNNPLYKYLGNEDLIQCQVINYLELRYNVTAIPCNTESRKKPFEQLKFKVLGGRQGILDIFVPVARKEYNGLFLELKEDGVKVFQKDGDVVPNKTIQAQHKTILEHISNGYKAEFAIGFDQAKIIIDEYFK